MTKSSGWANSAKYWKTVPGAANAMLLAGIFFLFTSFGLVLNFVNQTWIYVPWAILFALVTGTFSMVWAFAGFRRIVWVMVILLPIQFGVNVLIENMMRKYVPVYQQMEFSREAITDKLVVEGILAMFSIIAGYALVVGFIRKEGA